MRSNQLTSSNGYHAPKRPISDDGKSECNLLAIKDELEFIMCQSETDCRLQDKQPLFSYKSAYLRQKKRLDEILSVIDKIQASIYLGKQYRFERGKLKELILVYNAIYPSGNMTTILAKAYYQLERGIVENSPIEMEDMKSCGLGK